MSADGCTSASHPRAPGASVAQRILDRRCVRRIARGKLARTGIRFFAVTVLDELVERQIHETVPALMLPPPEPDAIVRTISDNAVAEQLNQVRQASSERFVPGDTGSEARTSIKTYIYPSLNVIHAG